MAWAQASPAGEEFASVSRRSASVNRPRLAAATPCATPAAAARNVSGHLPALPDFVDHLGPALRSPVDDRLGPRQQMLGAGGGASSTASIASA